MLYCYWDVNYWGFFKENLISDVKKKHQLSFQTCRKIDGTLKKYETSQILRRLNAVFGSIKSI